MPITINGSTGIAGIDGSAGTPALQGSDTNTGISFGTDVILASTGGTERWRVDSSGRMLVGTSTARSNFFNTSIYIPRFQIEGTDFNGAMLSVVANATTNINPNIILAKSGGSTVGSTAIVASGDALGALQFQGADGTELVQAAQIVCEVDGTPGANDMPGRLVFSTTADGASSPTERMRIDNNGLATFSGRMVIDAASDSGTQLVVQNLTGISFQTGAGFFTSEIGWNAAAAKLYVARANLGQRSINAAGTINASGADYAEYMTKAGEFAIAKGDVCGVTADGKLTKMFADAVGFLVKSSNPSYVGGDTWGAESVVGAKPGEDEPELLAEWEAALEAERQKVDRIAFAGQVPVNVTGATPGQYIVPIAAEDGGITGIAKNEADLTLPEYMRAVGKVIAIEDDGRARIIVKVA